MARGQAGAAGGRQQAQPRAGPPAGPRPQDRPVERPGVSALIVLLGLALLVRDARRRPARPAGRPVLREQGLPAAACGLPAQAGVRHGHVHRRQRPAQGRLAPALALGHVGQLVPAPAQQDHDVHRAVTVLPAVDGAPAQPHGLRKPRRGPRGRLPPAPAAAQRAPPGGCRPARPGSTGLVFVPGGRFGAYSHLPSRGGISDGPKWAGGRLGDLHPLTPVSSSAWCVGGGVLCGCFLLLQTTILHFPRDCIRSSWPVCGFLPL